VSEQSFESLVNEHGGRVLRTALRVLRDDSLAHDVHQEVFLAIWRRWRRYNGNVNWPAYLYRATVRKALELARRRAVGGVPVRASKERVANSCRGHPPLESGAGSARDSRAASVRLRPAGPPGGAAARRARHEAAGTAATETPDGVTTSGPADVLQADELQQRLAAALARLPRRQADAFVLCRLEGLEAAEAAGIMGCAPETVRVHLHRALQRLARELQEYLGPAGPWKVNHESSQRNQ
jgi:RNA polymerase sigma factor (sigma-70 family)